MFIFIVSAFAIKLVAVMVFLACRRNAVAGTPARANPLDDPEHPMNSDRYWGISIVAPEGAICCQEAKNLKDRKFPKREAPALPLPGCTMMGCQCKYEYLPERRSGIDRRSLLNYVPKEAERRTGVDRRKANNVWRGNSHL